LSNELNEQKLLDVATFFEKDDKFNEWNPKI
jgi:hypothetical protein